VHRRVSTARPPAYLHQYGRGENMGEANTIACPYCATRFRFNPRLTPFEADPSDCFFAVDASPGEGQLPRVASRSGILERARARAV
jgi:hypothetical protein